MRCALTDRAVDNISVYLRRPSPGYSRHPSTPSPVHPRIVQPPSHQSSDANVFQLDKNELLVVRGKPAHHHVDGYAGAHVASHARPRRGAHAHSPPRERPVLHLTGLTRHVRLEVLDRTTITTNNNTTNTRCSALSAGFGVFGSTRVQGF